MVTYDYGNLTRPHLISCRWSEGKSPIFKGHLGCWNIRVWPDCYNGITYTLWFCIRMIPISSDWDNINKLSLHWRWNPAWPHNLWLTKSPPFRAVQVRDRRQWVTLVHPPPCQPSRLAIRCMSGDRKLEHSEGMGKGKLVWVSWGLGWVGWVFGNTTKPWTLRFFFFLGGVGG